jgi:hypothetical protein
VHAQDEHTHARQPPHHLPRRFDPIHQRHADVQDGDVRLRSQRLADGVAAVAGLGDDFPFGSLFENLAQPLAHQRVIVAEQNPQLTH